METSLRTPCSSCPPAIGIATERHRYTAHCGQLPSLLWLSKRITTAVFARRARFTSTAANTCITNALLDGIPITPAQTDTEVVPRSVEVSGDPSPGHAVDGMVRGLTARIAA